MSDALGPDGRLGRELDHLSPVYRYSARGAQQAAPLTWALFTLVSGSLFFALSGWARLYPGLVFVLSAVVFVRSLRGGTVLAYRDRIVVRTTLRSFRWSYGEVARFEVVTGFYNAVIGDRRMLQADLTNERTRRFTEICEPIQGWGEKDPDDNRVDLDEACRRLNALLEAAR